MRKFPLYRQLDTMDCGPACLRMIAQYYGKHYTLETLRAKLQISREGVSLLDVSNAADSIGFKTLGVNLKWKELKTGVVLPILIYLPHNHFVVVYRITIHTVFVADPGKGLVKYKINDFLDLWMGKHEEQSKGLALIFLTTDTFYELADEKKDKPALSHLFKFFTKYKTLLIQIFIGLCIESLIQFSFPFLTQSLVDVGINSKNLDFVGIILVAQVFLFLGQASVEAIRSWILIHMSSRINISILYEFIEKLMRLPISFFDTKMTGDIIQRMNDHLRIENFLTGQTLITVFGSLTLIVFSIVLGYYDPTIFLIFFIASLFHVGWILLFLKKRGQLDNQQFQIHAKNQSAVIQLIQGMQEIKLTNSEKQKKEAWGNLQIQTFKLQLKSLALTQYQEAGAFFFTYGKNILISYYAAVAVINGHISLGAMLAIQYIIGQLNAPIQQLITFAQATQDAKISLERLNEINKFKDEDDSGKEYNNNIDSQSDITFQNVDFHYPGTGNEPILKNFSANFRNGKVTAIVGLSGSGKTTILKLLLKFYQIQGGGISIGDIDLEDLNSSAWRNMCGTVMQEGYIFSDTIMNNIAVGESQPDLERLNRAVEIANIKDFIEDAPMGFNTMIGMEGNGISQGQRQRILIARVVYKNPPFVFLDEATNALDTSNESSILKKLDHFFEDKTVIIIAHRLSTIKKADHIIVLNNGEIAERGTHAELIKNEGAYYKLIEAQFEIEHTTGNKN
jgi:ATP-binding cassette subfamily B protein